MTTRILKRQPHKNLPPVTVIDNRPQVDIPLELPPKPEPKIKQAPVFSYDFDLPKISAEIEPEPVKEPAPKKVVQAADSGLTKDELLRAQLRDYTNLQISFNTW